MISSPTFLSILAIFQRIEVFQKETEPSDIMLYVINADPEAIGAGHEVLTTLFGVRMYIAASGKK